MPYRKTGGCPHCGGSFLRRQASTYSYRRCTDCDGVWIEWNVLTKLVRDIEPDHKWEMVGVHEERKRQCPKCNGRMLRSTILNVPVDYCKTDEHGVWLDKDELKLILEAVADPESSQTAPPSSFTSLLGDFFNK